MHTCMRAQVIKTYVVEHEYLFSMFVCVCVNMYARVNVCARVRTCMLACGCMCVFGCVCECARMHTCMRAQVIKTYVVEHEYLFSMFVKWMYLYYICTSLPRMN